MPMLCSFMSPLCLRSHFIRCGLFSAALVLRTLESRLAGATSGVRSRVASDVLLVVPERLRVVFVCSRGRRHRERPAVDTTDEGAGSSTASRVAGSAE